MTIELTIVSCSIFDIDSEQETHNKINLDNVEEDALKQFVSALAKKTVSDSSTKIAKFDDDSQALKSLSELAKQHTKTEHLDKLAKRLLAAEISQNARSGHLNKIKSGSLIIAKIKGSESEMILVSKIEFESYLAKQTFLSQQGLPQDKGLLKSCLLTIENNSIAKKIVLSDSNSTVASFWYKDFLQSKFLKDDSLNTKIAIRELTNCLGYIKKESVDDYLDLKDRVNSYFLSHSTFEFDDFEKELLNDFKPLKAELDIVPLQAELSKVRKVGNFDGKFTIDKAELKKRIKKSFQLDNEVTVVAKSGISTIFKTTSDGQTYIVIKTNTSHTELKEIKI
jgi:hypothetical protein